MTIKGLVRRIKGKDDSCIILKEGLTKDGKGGKILNRWLCVDDRQGNIKGAKKEEERLKIALNGGAQKETGVDTGSTPQPTFNEETQPSEKRARQDPTTVGTDLQQP